MPAVATTHTHHQTRYPYRLIEGAVADPDAIVDLARSTGPYFSIARYFTTGAATEVFSAGKTTTEAAAYKCEWVQGGRTLVPEGEPFLHNERIVEQVVELFGAHEVRPFMFQAGTWVPQRMTDPGHTDTPEFRGISRIDYPIWFTVLMHHSGLFTPWRVPIATSVIWFYDGPGGDFRFWPDGPDGPELRERPGWNRAIVADTDHTFHCVASVGPPGAQAPPEADGSSEMVFRDGAWLVVRGDDVVASYPPEEIRISFQWKAQVFPDAAAVERYDGHTDDLTLDRVVDTFLSDLHEKGHEVTEPTDPLNDEDLIRTLTRAYMRLPTSPA